jgi:hypothetical protein
MQVVLTRRTVPVKQHVQNTYLVLQVEVRPRPDQRLHHAHVAVFRGGDERRAALL